MVPRLHRTNVRKVSRARTVAMFAVYIGCIAFLSLFVVGVL